MGKTRTFWINPLPFVPFPPIKLRLTEEGEGRYCFNTCFTLKESTEGKRYLVASTSVFLLFLLLVVARFLYYSYFYHHRSAETLESLVAFSVGAAIAFTSFFFLKEKFAYATVFAYLLLPVFFYAPHFAFSALLGTGSGVVAYWGYSYYSSPVYAIIPTDGRPVPKGYWLTEVEE